MAPLFLLDLAHAPYAVAAARRAFNDRESVFSVWARSYGIDVAELLSFARTLSEVALSVGETGTRFGRYGRDILLGTLNEAWMRDHERLLSEHCNAQQLRECLWQLEVCLAAAETAGELAAPCDRRTLPEALTQPRGKG